MDYKTEELKNVEENTRTINLVLTSAYHKITLQQNICHIDIRVHVWGKFPFFKQHSVHRQLHIILGKGLCHDIEIFR